MCNVLKSKVVKIRQPRKCYGCAEEFEKGSKLRFQKEVEGGFFSTSYWCNLCDITIKSSYIEQVDCGISMGQVKGYHQWEENSKKHKRTY